MFRKLDILRLLVLPLLLPLLFTSCDLLRSRYVVGVSLCRSDRWRDQMTREIIHESTLQDDITVEFSSANGSDERQIAQLRKFIEQRVDLIIVDPNRMESLEEVIEQAYNASIPIVVIHRRLTSDSHITAYIGVDDYKMGKMAGECVAEILNNRGRVIETLGIKGSSTTIDRHRGFTEALRRYPEIEIVSSVNMRGEASSPKRIADSLLMLHTDVDLIFSQHDTYTHKLTTRSKELGVTRDIKYVGIGVITTTQDMGVDLVDREILTATVAYSSGGHQIMQTAANILSGKPFEKYQNLDITVINSQNVDVVKMQTMQLQALDERLGEVGNRIVDQQRSTMQWLLLLVVISLAVGMMAVVLVYIVKRLRDKNRDITSERDHLERQHKNLIKARGVTVLSSADEAATDVTTKEMKAATEYATDGEGASGECTNPKSQFIAMLLKYLDENLSNPDLSIDEITTYMKCSRMQLYRKVKGEMGSSPNQLLRNLRLQRADRLLRDGDDRSIATIAYDVGFTSPSYFTKSYREYFGVAPSSAK